MLFMLQAQLAKPAGMSNKEFYGIWLQEAEAAVAALKGLNPTRMSPGAIRDYVTLKLEK
jgi:hypothetical protein